MNSPVLAWYIAGPLIGLFVPLFILLTGKQFGISSSFRAIISSLTGKKIDYFNYPYRNDFWQVYVVLGLVLAAIVNFQFIGFDLNSFPYESANPFLFLVGGILIGFGSRYANGCTAGHCIMGNAQFSIASFVATIGFFIGGLVVTHFIIPLIF